MTLDTIDITTGPQPTASIMVLHGLGADGHDFEPVAQQIDLRSVGPVRWVFPHSPVRPVSINGGMVMPAWYDIHPPIGGQRKEDEAGLRSSQALIEALIRREQDRGVAAGRIVLAGFSQGCAMTLMTGLRHPVRLAGLAALSGYLPLPGQLAAERSAAMQDTPIFMAHGRFDDIVQMDRGLASREELQALGYTVEWHDYPMTHSVCAEELADLGQWLHKVLA